MSAKGLEANVQAYNTAISACEKTANWQAAFQLFAEMISKEVDVTEVTYGALISACEKADEASLALSCLQSALTVSLADEKSFNPAILVCSRNSFWPQALELFAQLPARQLASKADSYNAVLDGLGTSPTAMKIFREALEKQILSCKEDWLSLLDLHELSASSAKLATCWFLAEVLPKRRPWPKRFRPGIIVGQELHSPSSRRAESAGNCPKRAPHQCSEELLRELHIDFKVKAGRVFLTLDGVDPKSLSQIFAAADPDGSGKLRRSVYLEILNSPFQVKRLQQTVKLHLEDIKHLFDLLDLDGAGTVDFDEFCESLDWISKPVTGRRLLKVDLGVKLRSSKVQQGAGTPRCSWENSVTSLESFA
eukprot:g507.t1